MALSVSQAITLSFNRVLNQKRGPENQWAANAFLREAEKQQMIKREAFGPVLEISLDYQQNASVQATSDDMIVLPGGKTDILTAAQVNPAMIVGNIVWSEYDEMVNSEPVRKQALVSSLIDNLLTSHDTVLEQACFATNNGGVFGFGTHCPTSGQGSDEGIDAATYTWWRLPSNTYVDDTDLEAGLTLSYNQQSKGTGESYVPTWAVSDGTTQALFEGSQQPQQRWVDDQDLKAGFRTIAFKTARWVFSQYASTSVFMGNPRHLTIYVARDRYRKLGDTEQLSGQQIAYTRKLFTGLQIVTSNRSRLSVTHV